MDCIDRFKMVRQSLGLTQTDFGAKIGLSRAAVSSYEHRSANLTDVTIKCLCVTFGVSEQWLRTGEGDMFTASPSDPLDQLLADHRLGPGGRALLGTMVRAFMTLDADSQDILYNQVVASLRDAIDQPPEVMSESDDPGLIATLDKIIDDYEATVPDADDKNA